MTRLCQVPSPYTRSRPDSIDLKMKFRRKLERERETTYTGMINRLIASDPELGASGDADSCRGRVSLRIIAAEVRAGDIRDWRLRVIVVRLTDVDPCRSGDAVHDQRREGV